MKRLNVNKIRISVVCIDKKRERKKRRQQKEPTNWTSSFVTSNREPVLNELSRQKSNQMASTD